MWYVHILLSDDSFEREYTVATADLRQRLAGRNARKSKHAAKFARCTLIWYGALPDKLVAGNPLCARIASMQARVHFSPASQTSGGIRQIP